MATPIHILVDRLNDWQAKESIPKCGFTSLEDVAKKTERELSKIPGIGKKSLATIKEVLAEHNLSLAG